MLALNEADEKPVGRRFFLLFPAASSAHPQALSKNANYVAYFPVNIKQFLNYTYTVNFYFY